MCLLDRVETWDRQRLSCSAISHLASDNPLRRRGRLAGLCGAEYGLQAAAVHGGLLAGEGAAPPGYLAALRHVAILAPRLDVPAFGRLVVEAELLLSDVKGWVYAFSVRSQAGEALVTGRGVIALI